jgi:pimeloyl-ACP methyl ester carboxylesterase
VSGHGAEPGGTTTVLVPDETGSLAFVEALVPAVGPGRVAGLTGGPLTAGADLGSLAAGHARRLRAAGLDQVRIVGYGLGAVLALEVARAAADAGTHVVELVLAAPDRPVADLGWPEPTLYAGDVLLLSRGPANDSDNDSDSDGLEFWQGLCLGELRVADIDVGVRP